MGADLKIAITGGTGFVGRHLARSLTGEGHAVVLIARGVDRRDEAIHRLPGATFLPIGTSDEGALAAAFAGCDTVAHLAGINREIGPQTYQRVHVEGTHNVVQAAGRTSVSKVLLLSFLRARPGCGSPYHESKWAAEEIVRSCGLEYTVFKAGVIYGKGDHMLASLQRSLRMVPVFPLVGSTDPPVRPLAVEDLVPALGASLLDGRLSRQTVAVTGPEELPFGEAVRRVARVLGRRVHLFPAPLWSHSLIAQVCERVMADPLVSLSEVRMLSENMAEPLPACEGLPEDLAPKLPFSDEQIRRGVLE